jgi:MFS family permease
VETRGLWRTLQELPRPVWLLVGGTLVNRFGSFVLVFLVLYVRHLGYSTAAAGTAASAYGIGSIGSSLVGGWLADRLGRRSAIALSMFSSAAAMLALSQVRPLPAIVALSVAVGLTSELYRPASAALMADLVSPEQRVAAFGLWRFAINLGFAVGPLVAGVLAQRSFFYLFAGDAATSVAFGALALASLPQGRRADSHLEVRGETVRARSIGQAIVEQARERGVDLIVLGSSPRWRRQSRFFSPTVDYVLKKAPSEVLIVAFPQGVLEGDGAPS